MAVKRLKFNFDVSWPLCQVLSFQLHMVHTNDNWKSYLVPAHILWIPLTFFSFTLLMNILKSTLWTSILCAISKFLFILWTIDALQPVINFMDYLEMNTPMKTYINQSGKFLKFIECSTRCRKSTGFQLIMARYFHCLIFISNLNLSISPPS